MRISYLIMTFASTMTLQAGGAVIGAHPYSLGSFMTFPDHGGLSQVVIGGLEGSNATLLAVNDGARFNHREGFESYKDISFHGKTVGHQAEDPTAMAEVSRADSSSRRERLTFYSSTEAKDNIILSNGVMVAKKPVTNKEYARFVKKTGHTPPAHWKKNSYPRGKGSEAVVNVSFEDARGYARWAEKRLPTYEEWMSAADQLSWDLEMPKNEWTSSVSGADADGVKQVIMGTDDNMTLRMAPTSYNDLTGFRLASDS